MAENSTLNAAQIQVVQKLAREWFASTMTQMELRKWAIEQAIGIYSSPGVVGLESSMTKMAEQIYDFVAKPALEFKVDQAATAPAEPQERGPVNWPPGAKPARAERL
jgi:hypothetical protein